MISVSPSLTPLGNLSLVSGWTDLRETDMEPVRFHGVKYQSMLEARWAAFFYHLGWKTTYDPYLDKAVTFLVHDRSPFLVRVTDEIVTQLSDRHRDTHVLVVGISPFVGREFGEGPRVVDAWAKATNDIAAVAA